MSTHPILPGTKVPFPCWLHNKRLKLWHWFESEPQVENWRAIPDLYSTLPPSQRPEEVPTDDTPEKCEVCGGDEPCSHDFDKIGWPTPRAPSLQSVAEGAANEQAKFVESMCDKLGGVGLVSCFKGILTRYFAPVYAAITERDERIGRLEEAREDALQALGEHPESETDLAQRIREIRQEGRDLFHDITALRDRCEELERDKERLDWLDANRGCRNAPQDSKAWHLSVGGTPGKKSTLRMGVRAAIDAARKEGQQAHEKGVGA